VRLAQAHRPGEAAQTGFTEGASLRVTINGELYEHLLCIVALPYSNWSWATVCLSESLIALTPRTTRIGAKEQNGDVEARA